MFTLPKLPYGFDALEPHIDSKTMEIHYTKHHQTYCDKLNAGLEKHPEYKKLSLEELVSDLKSLPTDLKPIVRNHGWGMINHNIFWETLIPSSEYKEPDKELEDIISKHFEDISSFKKSFEEKATTLFWSGWTWLEMDGKELKITNYPNQENPLMEGKKPILWLDLREHAYYLKNQNRRPDYISARRQVVNRSQVKKNIK